MRATINKEGVLLLTPETELERFAVGAWNKGDRQIEILQPGVPSENNSIMSVGEHEFKKRIMAMLIGEKILFAKNGKPNMRGSIWQAATNLGFSVKTKATPDGIEVERIA